MHAPIVNSLEWTPQQYLWLQTFVNHHNATVSLLMTLQSQLDALKASHQETVHR